jgi:hypothetical protein
MASGPAEFRPFERPSGGGLRLMWGGLHDAGGGLWPSEEWVVDDNSLRTMIGPALWSVAECSNRTGQRNGWANYGRFAKGRASRSSTRWHARSSHEAPFRVVRQRRWLQRRLWSRCRTCLAESDGGGEGREGMKDRTAGFGAPWRTYARGRAKFIAATSSRGPCRVRANGSGPRGLP